MRFIWIDLGGGRECLVNIAMISRAYKNEDGNINVHFTDGRQVPFGGEAGADLWQALVAFWKKQEEAYPSPPIYSRPK